jgi:WD40 repeat protein
VYQPGTGSLLTAAADGYARLWTVPGRQIIGAPGAVSTVAFATSSRDLVVSSSTSGPEASIAWSDISNPRRPKPLDRALAPPAGASRFTGASALSTDDRLLAVGSADGTSRLWDVTDRSRPTLLGGPLTGPTSTVETLAFTNTGHTLAVGSDDHRVFLWDTRTPTAPRHLSTLTDPTNIVMTVAFSPDGHLLAAASVDNHTYLWDTTDPARPHLLRTLAGHTNYAYAVAFSPDGHTLAIGSADKTVTLWDVRDPREPRPLGDTLTGPTNYVYSVAFTPDGHLLAAASTDGTIWTWDLTTTDRPQPFATLRAASPVYALAISPDSTTLAAGTADKSVRLWSLAPDRAIDSICSTAGDPVSPAEWRQYVPDLTYTPPCTRPG